MRESIVHTMAPTKYHFVPSHVLGLVCDASATACAPCIHQQGLASFLTTPVDNGTSLHLYDMKLKLKGALGELPESWSEGDSRPGISHVAARHELTFLSLGCNIGVCFHFKPFALWKAHQSPIRVMQIVGDYLVSVGKDGRVVAWTLPDGPKDGPSKDGIVWTDMFLPPEHKVTSMTHPQTYKNKILLGTEAGSCILLNVKTKKIIHVFDSFKSPIQVLTASPVIDVVAVGMKNGMVSLHNFRVDETIMTFTLADDGLKSESETTVMSSDHNGVGCIAFRTEGDESMMTADRAGNMFTWNLNTQKLISASLNIHTKGAMFAEYLPGEPLLLSCGISDNAIKLHLFDNVTGQPRVLRSRIGHHLPPTVVRFCGQDGFSMVSAGMDRGIRLLCAVSESRNEEMSQRTSGRKSKKRRRGNVLEGATQGTETRKLPPVVAMACSNLRERDEEFANIVTIHEDSDAAHTWRLRNAKKHKHVLTPPVGRTVIELQSKADINAMKSKKKKEAGAVDSDQRGNAQSVALTFCGTHCLVGYENGELHCFNMQSGRHIGAYEEDEVKGKKRQPGQAKPMTLQRWRGAHKGAVVSIAIDACGDLLASAGGMDKKLKFWNLQLRRQEGDDISIASGITSLEWSRASDLIAVATEDFSVLIYDASTRQLARRFSGHAGPISDICFAPKGRHVLSAAMDQTVRIWDLPSGRLYERYNCDNAPTSLAMGPDGNHFATTHVNELGVTMWVNGQSQKKKTESEDTMDIDENESAENKGTTSVAHAITSDAEENVSQPVSPKNAGVPVSDHLITLSSKPSMQWTILSNLSAVRERNKPVDQLKKPEAAPFFIPTKKGLETQFDLNAEMGDGTNGSQDAGTKINGHSRHDQSDSMFDDDLLPSTFGKLVVEHNYDAASKLLQKLGPSAVDLEIRTVGGSRARQSAAKYFVHALNSPLNFELAHAHLSVFLKSQGLELAEEEKGRKLLKDLLSAQAGSWERLRSTMNAVSCLSAYFSGQV